MKAATPTPAARSARKSHLGIAKTIFYFASAVKESTVQSVELIGAMPLLTIVTLAVFLFTAFSLEGPHQKHILPIKIYAAWYSKWFALGVLSTVGLGLGTFLLFLGPFIAKCATTAHSCRSVDFQVFGPRAFSCSSTGSTGYGPLDVLNKIKVEVLLWGLGTAFGYLPTFLLARLAGQKRSAPLLENLVPVGRAIGLLGFIYLASVSSAFITDKRFRTPFSI